MDNDNIEKAEDELRLSWDDIEVAIGCAFIKDPKVPHSMKVAYINSVIKAMKPRYFSDLGLLNTLPAVGEVSSKDGAEI